MITRKTVLIVGAGGSSHLGFPTGPTLKANICTLLEPKRAQKAAKLRDLLGGASYDTSNLETFLRDFQQSPLESVDAFLEHRPEFMDAGKAIIAAQLIPHENPNVLYGHDPESDWYRYLFNRWKTRLESYIENKLAIITFNYDRSLEQYFYKGLKTTHDLDSISASNVLDNLPIVYLHGQLGPLSRGPNEGRIYNDSLSSSAIKQSADSIRIVHEDNRMPTGFMRAHHYMAEADVVCFLGFGFHPTNISRLKLDHLKSSCEVYASRYQMGNADKANAERHCKRTIQWGLQKQNALQMLREYDILHWE